MRLSIRQNIESILKNNKIISQTFAAVSINSWEKIFKKIISTFCTISHNDQVFWLWMYFKQNTYSVQLKSNWEFKKFSKLINSSEKVWLLINDDEKFWIYEGLIDEIIFVLGESFVDEVYICSKKYEWLLCLNHHDVLIATGSNMPGKLKQLENS